MSGKKLKKHKMSHWGLKDKMALFLFIMMGIMVVFSVVIGIKGDGSASGPNITFEEYEKRELALDDSTENVLYVEQGSTEQTKTVQPVVQEPAVTESDQVITGNGQEQESEKYDLTGQVEIPDVEYPYYIKVNRAQNCVTVYTMNEQGEYEVPVKAMVCSVGLNNNTPLGVFQTSTKYKWRALFGNVYGQYAYRIHDSIMFHSVPYYSTNKDDLETEEYNKLGEPASLGCIRLACIDAKWLVDNCPEGTTVEIYDDEEEPGPLGRPEPVTIDVDSENAGWDPTDPDKKNPWKTNSGSAESGMSDGNSKESTQEASETSTQKQVSPPVIDYAGELETSLSVQNNPEDVVCENARMMARLLISNGIMATDAAATYEITPDVECISSSKIYDTESGELAAVSVVVRVTAEDADGSQTQKDYTVLVKVEP